VSPPDDGPQRPGVYARLAEQAEIERAVRTPPRWAKWLGWGICIAIFAAVLASALEAHPW
jgi:hypothetical protein